MRGVILTLWAPTGLAAKQRRDEQERAEGDERADRERAHAALRRRGDRDGGIAAL